MIEILKHKSLDKGFLTGFVDVKFTTEYGSLYIKDISLFKKGQERWISFPSQPYEVEGKKKYKPYAGFEKPENMQKFQKELFEKIEKYTATTAVTARSTPLSFEGEIPF